MKSTRIALAVAALACALSVPAAAAPITLNASLDGLLSGTQSGRFDASEVLNGNYKINSLSFSFNFSDDGDLIKYGNPVAGGRVPAEAGFVHNPAQNGKMDDPHNRKKELDKLYYNREVTAFQSVLGMGEQEGATLWLGGVAVGSGATALKTKVDVRDSEVEPEQAKKPEYTAGFKACDKNGNNCSWQNGKWEYFTDQVTTKTTTTTNTWTGDFGIADTTTDASIIAQLLSNKYLDFSLDLTGDLFLKGAQISFDVTEIEAEVPEPSSALLMLAALGGLGYSMRRRSAKQ